MATSNQEKIIFMAFANDRNDQTRYLRQLDEEARRARTTLSKAEDAQLCKVILRQNATVEEILDVFQHPDYRNRIVLFHFGGHANGYQLLLESSEGQPAAAHAGGLAAFLGQQESLQLVFLNGCSTHRQVEGLLEAGVSTVIATSQSIDDQIATDFSSRFYEHLIDGSGTRMAYDSAASAVKQTSNGNTRALYQGRDALLKGMEELIEERWPWDLYFREGAETAAKWNLPEAVGKPLFGLPPLPQRDLPHSPFRHLSWFAEEHADVFFGRGYQIRALYNAVTSPSSAPILLLYGQTGVGKSSLLHAGLVPRLKADYETIYLRRKQSLLETLKEALELDSADESLGEAWLAREQRLNKPLNIILDQVEEAFTRPRPSYPNELPEFWQGLRGVFANPDTQPQGKLILGFRKEWLSPVEERLKEHKLHHTKLFLEQLDRRGILEAITGVIRTPYLQDHYRLSIEDGLPEIIADDLLEDQASAIAPTLQLLLTKMWSKAKAENEREPHFSQELYDKLRRKGILLGDFLDQQLATMQERLPEAWDSGLVLDVLQFHTTPFGYAAKRTIAELEEIYSHQVDALPTILQECKDLYLLTEPGNLTQDEPSAMRLAHDALAPLVRKRVDESDRPGQRAHRLLETHMREWNNQPGDPLLDERSLRIIEEGQDGTRARKPGEEELIAKSRQVLKSSKPLPLTETLFPPHLPVKEFIPDEKLVVAYGAGKEITFDLREHMTKAQDAPIKDAIRYLVEEEGSQKVGVLRYSNIEFYRGEPKETQREVGEQLVPFYLSLNFALGHGNLVDPLKETRR